MRKIHTGVPTDYILVIGESARKDYFHSYGYPVENTPFLDNNFTVKVDGMKSGGTYTIGSLTNMLTVPDKGKWKPRYDRSIIDLARSAGIRTYWLSNQGMVGKFDTPVSAIGRKADKAIFLNKGDYSEKNISDFSLLKPFKQILDQKTDQFIEKVFELLKKEKSVTGRPFSIIYFSDHGLAHKTEKNKTTLTNNFASKFHYDIPLIKIDSDRNDRIELSSEKSGLNFTEGLGNWMNIQNPDLPKTSLFDGKNDLTDYGLKEKINLITTPKDPAIDLTGKLK
ncbi:phosphoethanolamine transferase [Parasutterella excrementihominis]|uniref:phosphoethanolamine transferase n=1 Tax=Parasutterella excrementihominis TaxID=487175 RepID=UPI00356449D7